MSDRDIEYSIYSKLKIFPSYVVINFYQLKKLFSYNEIKSSLKIMPFPAYVLRTNFNTGKLFSYYINVSFTNANDIFIMHVNYK